MSVQTLISSSVSSSTAADAATVAPANYDIFIAIGVSVLFGFLIGYMVLEKRKKMWNLETMDPRQQYEVGTENKLISHMNVGNRFFYGVEAGKYKILLMWGDISVFSKPIMAGKLEEMYSSVLANSLIGRNMVNRVEKTRFYDFLYKHVPSLTVKAYMITGELVSPQDVLDYYWKPGDERDRVFAEMKRRKLIDSKVLWVRPYPPEAQLKEIMTGVLTVPHILMGHIQEYEKLTKTNRDVLLQIDSGTALMLKEVIQLEREIVISISDPIHVISAVITDRIRKVKGLGLEQLAERGSAEAQIEIAKKLREHTDELVKAFQQPITETDMAAITQQIGSLQSQVSAIMSKLSESANKSQAPALPTPPPQQGH